MAEDKKRIITKRHLNILWIIYVLISIIVLLPKIDKLFCAEYSSVEQNICIDEEWNIKINDNVYNNVSLKELCFEAVKKGDYIVMEKKLPKDLVIKQGVLRINVRQAAMKVYIDDELIYEYGNERLLQKKTVGSGFQFVDFLESYKGKQLKIELIISEDDAFSRFDSIRIYEWKNVYKALITENRIPMFLGSFLLIFGIAIVIITSIAMLFSKKYARMLFIALFSICIGLWTLCYYHIMNIFSIPVYSITLIEYIALYLAPIPVTIYMHNNVSNLKNKFLKGIFWILLGVEIIFDIVVITLHSKDIIHCAAALKYMQIIIVFGLIYFIAVLFMNIKNSKLTNRLYLIGMLIIFICTGYDLINYYSERYYAQPLFSIKGLIAIGVTIFVFILIFSFYINITEKIMQEKERKILIKMAYTDELTQLFNRHYCAEYMTEMEKNNKDYTIFCFDLNNLKFMNDTYGHARGDVLIKSAANVISDTFGTSGVVGRMGGDEFIAILPVFQKEEIEHLKEVFNENIVNMNKQDKELNLSIAYGYAASTEIDEKNIEKVYQMADNRMYNNKNEYKKSLQKVSLQ